MRKIALLILFGLVLIINPALAEGTKYTCPMHPHYISAEPGKCPICGMDLVPIEDHSEHKTHVSIDINPEPIAESKTAEERDAITIAPEIIQNMGVRTEKAEDAVFGADVRSYGVVTENEREQYEVSSRVSGWIKELKVTAVGDEVKNGQLLFTLYSPDLIAAQQDYIAALATSVEDRISSSAKLLKALGIQDQTLKQIENNHQKLQDVPFYAEVDGVISKLDVKRGTFVESGMQIAEIQNYSSVWINVSVAEKDLGFLSEGMKADVTFSNLSSKSRTAYIDYIYPTINKMNRTGQVRLVLDNSDGVLRPGAYAYVNFETTLAKHLAIPSEAILRSSDGNYVVVALGNGRFQSRKVETGVYNKGRVQILSGLNGGEDIVVSSQFLIDSESSLRESFRKMQTAPTKGGHAGH